MHTIRFRVRGLVPRLYDLPRNSVLFAKRSTLRYSPPPSVRKTWIRQLRKEGMEFPGHFILHNRQEYFALVGVEVLVAQAIERSHWTLQVATNNTTDLFNWRMSSGVFGRLSLLSLLALSTHQARRSRSVRDLDGRFGVFGHVLDRV